MLWYYTNEERQQSGPIADGEFTALVKSGVIRGDTLVWQEGFPQWIQYSEVGRGAAGGNAALAGAERCSECGGAFAQEDMVNFSGSWVCAACKPLYVQKLREGAPTGAYTTGWRSGKRLVLPINSTLPQRCIKCNAPTIDPQKKRKLYWHHPAIYLTILVSLLIYLIVALCCRKRATTFVSICPRHSAARRNAIIVSWLLCLGGAAGFCYGIATSNGANSGLMIFAGIIVFLIGLIYGFTKGRLVVATRITKDFMWLRGCKPEFLAEFPEWTGPK